MARPSTDFIGTTSALTGAAFAFNPQSINHEFNRWAGSRPTCNSTAQPTGVLTDPDSWHELLAIENNHRQHTDADPSAVAEYVCVQLELASSTLAGNVDKWKCSNDESDHYWWQGRQFHPAAAVVKDKGGINSRVNSDDFTALLGTSAP